MDTGTANEKPNDQVQFQCSNCILNAKCKFGPLKLESSRYLEDVFYMRDPFEPPDVHKKAADYTVDDFLCLGGICFICQQQICFDEGCSTFYKHYYCMNCVQREKHSFPREITATIERRLKAAKDE